MIQIQSEYNQMQIQSQRRCPSGPRLLFMMQGDLVGDSVDTRRTRFDFKEPPLSLTGTEPLPPRHIFLVQSLDP